jgi:hypothetical protein
MDSPNAYTFPNNLGRFRCPARRILSALQKHRNADNRDGERSEEQKGAFHAEPPMMNVFV